MKHRIFGYLVFMSGMVLIWICSRVIDDTLANELTTFEIVVISISFTLSICGIVIVACSPRK